MYRARGGAGGVCYGRIGDRRDAADSGCAGRKRRRWDEELIPLRRGRTAAHARTRKRIDVRIRFREAVREGLQEGDDLVLFLIAQAEIAGRAVDIVFDLGHRPAVHLLGCSWRAVPGRDREGVQAARIVEVDKLLQALDVTIVEEPLLEVGPRRLGGRTLWRHEGHIARGRYLELAVGRRRERYPLGVRVGSGTEAAPEEGPHSQVSVAEAEGIGGEAEGIRRGLIVKGVPRIQGQPFIG